MMWAWAYLAGWVVTAVVVCRSGWLALDPEERDESPAIGRGLTLAAGLAAGAVWPVWWAGVLLRPVLWPEPNPDLPSAFATFHEHTDQQEHDQEQ